MSKRLAADHLARSQAVDPLRSFIVQAPAGSGKTSLLTDRILTLLSRVDQPERVLAMTFTRKAAAEMHGRVMEKLRLGCEPQPPQSEHDQRSWALARQVLAHDQAQGWDLLAHPARLRIQTIDAFCASMVRSMPSFTGMGGLPAIAADPRPIYEQAAIRTLALAGEQEGVRCVLEHLDLSFTQAMEAIADMLGRRDHWLPLLHGSRDGNGLQASLLAVMTRELECLSNSMPLGWQHQLAPAVRLAAAYFAGQSGAVHPSAALAQWQPGGLLPDPGMIDAWRALADLLLTSGGEVRQRVTVGQGCPPGSEQKAILMGWLNEHAQGRVGPEWARRLDDVRCMPDPELTVEQLAILKAQSETLSLAAAQLMVCFAERGEVDFIEIAQRAVQALGQADDPSDLLLKLDNRLQHILVDEFQDTSHVQLRLLSLLTAGWQPDDGRTLFLVGDPMQSIYRFRKADVGLFIHVQTHGVGALPLTNLALTANFRSQQGLVTWVNQTFSQIFPPVSDPEMGGIVHTRADPWRAASLEPAVHWHLMNDESAAQAVVVELAKQAWTAFADSTVPMAILVRSRGHLGGLTQAIAAAGLPCRAVELVPLGQRAVVMDLLQLARALSHLGDRAAWLAVLRAPWCGLTLGTLHALLLGQGERTVVDCLREVLLGARPHAIEPDQWQRLSGTATRLLQALQTEDALPFAAWLESTWRALGGHRLVTQATDLADAEAFFRLVETVAQHRHVDIDQLERRLQALYAEPAAGARAIDVMTMHKAKGLEFESVVLYGLERPSVSDRVPLVRIDQGSDHLLFGPVKPSAQTEQDPLALYLARREAARVDYETDRLLYVAATRAREVLHLVGQVQPDPKAPAQWAHPQKNTLLRRLWAFRVLDDPPEAAKTAGDQPLDRSIWRAPVLTRRADGAVALDAAVQAPGREPLVWPSTETAERLSGILVHAWLARFAELGAEAAAQRQPTAERLAQQLRLLGMPAPLRDQAAREVQASLAAMLIHERGRWLLSQPLRRAEWMLADTQQAISVMDLAIDQGEQWLVVDYKTSQPDAHEPRLAFASRMLERYGSQLQRYIETLQAFDGRPARAALYFPKSDIWLDYPADASSST